MHVMQAMTHSYERKENSRAQKVFEGFKDHVYSSLIVEMKSERCPFWNIYFKNQAFWSKTQHTLFKIWSPLIVLYFENRN